MRDGADFCQTPKIEKNTAYGRLVEDDQLQEAIALFRAVAFLLHWIFAERIRKRICCLLKIDINYRKEAGMNKYGYARVSSKDQNPDRQYEALLQYGISPENIYTDQISGKDFNRPEYRALLRKLCKGDVLVVKSIDRLGRDYEEIIEQWRQLCKVREIDIEVIEFPLLNINQTKDGLTGVFISDITLQILAYLAQTEREFIRQRQAEGIAIAKAKGVRFGAERKMIPESFEQNYLLWKSGELSSRQAAKLSGMSHSTFYRRCQEQEDAKQS